MEKKKITLSVAIAVFNEEKNLDACLRSVASIADETVVVDGGSTDQTLEIAKRYKAKIIRTSNPPIFHINKQKALDACTGVWILQLDADEIVSQPLKDEILRMIKNGSTEFNGYYIPRRNYFWGHAMKKGGQYPDYVIRLVKNGKAQFPCKSVHEQITIDGNVGYLVSPLDHVSYRSTEDYWRKADRYTTLAAIEMKQSHTPKTVSTWFLYNIIKPIRTFVSIFIRHKGFLDGGYGFVFAYWSALHFLIAYKKFTKI
jgi:glycosyltransferase involved in cell wall biosynthesis